MTLTSMKSLTLIGLMALGVTPLVLAQQPPVQEALREVAVMRNIFNAVLEQDGKAGQQRQGSDRVRLNDALYLAHQGMVFNFSFGGPGRFFMGGGGGDMMGFNMPNMALLGEMLDMEMPEMGERFTIRAFQGGADPADPYQRQLQDMRQQLRQQHGEIRETQRELRDLMRQTRNGSQDEQVLRTEMEALQAQLQSMQDAVQSTQDNYRQLQQEYREENAQALNAGKREKSALVFQALCDYGNTLRSLGSGEYVTLVFRHYLDDEDMAFVIPGGALRDCASGETLAASATRYQPR